jgi:hypothetical protein
MEKRQGIKFKTIFSKSPFIEVLKKPIVTEKEVLSIVNCNVTKNHCLLKRETFVQTFAQ